VLSVWLTLERLNKGHVIFFVFLSFFYAQTGICTTLFRSLLIAQGTYVSQTPLAFLATVADVSGNPEPRQDINIKPSYIRRRLVIARVCLKSFLGIMDVTFPLPCLTYKNRGTLLKIIHVCNKGRSLDALRQQLQSP